jgi:hypothetical protein
MNPFIGIVAIGASVYVVASIGFAIAERRATMPEFARWFGVVGLFALGLPVAFLIRYIQAGFTEPERGLCLLAIVAGFGLPLRSFRKREKSK